jgi:hypothetical protein
MFMEAGVEVNVDATPREYSLLFRQAIQQERDTWGA